MAHQAEGVMRSPTFFVGAERQKKNLEEFHRREQQLAEAYQKNKPLCFHARGYQKTHPAQALKGHKDADARLESPMVVGVADGVSQIEDFGIDASRLPKELLKVCEELGMIQLLPGSDLAPQDTYRGPIPFIRRAFEATESLGSLTVVLAIMDNSSRIHGKPHPMIAIVSIGDCELVILRRVQGSNHPLQVICHTEMQRIDGHAQTPLQLARVDDRIDPEFHEEITIEVIEKGSAVHCVSAYEGDIVVMGSDGVFDNLFRDEIADLCNTVLRPGQQGPVSEAQLSHLAEAIVQACHEKTRLGPSGKLPQAPIGPGGKKDDTSCVVAEVVEWTEAHRKAFTPSKGPCRWERVLDSLTDGLSNLDPCCTAKYESDEELESRSEAPPGLTGMPVPAPPLPELTRCGRSGSSLPPWTAPELVPLWSPSAGGAACMGPYVPPIYEAAWHHAGAPGAEAAWRPFSTGRPSQATCRLPPPAMPWVPLGPLG